MKRYPAELSGGQRQRVGLARALAADPPLLLMDEPFGALDPITRFRLQTEMRRLQREVEKTVIFVTHDIDEAIQLGDRIAILREGGVLAQYDTPDAILAHPADDFVAKFIGEDRALRRLALKRLSGCQACTRRRVAGASRSRLARHHGPKRRLPHARHEADRLLVEGETARCSASSASSGRRSAALSLRPAARSSRTSGGELLRHG